MIFTVSSLFVSHFSPRFLEFLFLIDQLSHRCFLMNLLILIVDNEQEGLLTGV